MALGTTIFICSFPPYYLFFAGFCNYPFELKLCGKTELGICRVIACFWISLLNNFWPENDFIKLTEKKKSIFVV